MADIYDDGSQDPQENRLKPLNAKKIPVRKTAIALKEHQEEGHAPVVTAAGRGKIAEQILQLAFDNDINVREDKTLTEMLAAIELDSPIPSEAFLAVAEILAYVYKANTLPDPFDAE